MNFLTRMLTAVPLGIACNLSAQDSQGEADDEIFELNPFVVTADSDDGYLATTSLAGSRLNTPLRDLGAAITAVTEQFIEDTGSTDLTELLVYTVNTESAGLDGNSLGEVPAIAASNNAGLLEENDTRRNPQNSLRARGLTSMDRSRNFFTSSIPTDSYNINRVDIARGANALLFGLGSPAGVVNSSLITASTTRDHGKVNFRVGSYNSNRLTLDYNKVLIEDKLAVRVALLRDDKKYIQEPAFEKDERIFLTTTAHLLKTDSASLSFTGSYETGSIDALRPRRQGPGDRVNQWLVAGALERFADTDGTARPNFPRAFLPKDHPDYQVPGADWEERIDPFRDTLDIDLDYFDLNYRLFQNQSYRQAALIFDADSTEPTNIGHVSQRHSSWFDIGNPNNHPTGTKNYWVLDYPNRWSSQTIRASSFPLAQYDHVHNLVGGNHGGTEADLEALDLSLQGNFFNNQLGFDLSFASNTYEDEYERPFSYGGNSFIYVDPNRTFIDGRTNPNFGRMFLSPSTARSEGYNKQEAIRLTGYASYDFREKMDNRLGKILGHHRLLGLFSQHEEYDENLGSNLAFIGPDAAIAAGGRDDILHDERSVHQYLYFGDSIAGETAYEFEINPQITYTPPQAGEIHPVSIWDRTISDFRTTNLTTARVYQNGSNFERLETDSIALTLQSNWLDDSIVTIAGWRKDTANNYTAPNILPRINDSIEEGVDLNAITLSPEDEVSGDIWTYSAVAHVSDWFPTPRDLNVSLHYSQSENFQPEVGDINIYGELIDPPGGKTEEYGVTFATADNRSVLRLNWYETSIVNSRDIDVGPVVNQIRDVDLQTLEKWYESVYDYGNGWITQSDIDFLLAGIPQGYLDANGWQVIDNNASYSSGSFKDTSSVSANGVEVEATFNITNNWRLHFNASQTKAVASDIAPSLTRYIEERIKVWGNALTGDTTQISELPRSSTTYPDVDDVDAEGYPVYHSWESPAERAVGTIAALEEINRLNGADSSRLREWRYNIITNYNFSKDSRLKGVGVGAAYRWADEAIVNYRNTTITVNEGTEFEDEITVPDFNDPIVNPSTSNYDFWVSYKKKLKGDKVDWHLQFNMRNAFTSDNLIATSFTNTGVPTAYITTPPRTWSLSSTFKF